MAVKISLYRGNIKMIFVKVAGKRRNKGIGVEIPTTYTFDHKKESKITNTKIERTI